VPKALWCMDHREIKELFFGIDTYDMLCSLVEIEDTATAGEEHKGILVMLYKK